MGSDERHEDVPQNDTVHEDAVVEHDATHTHSTQEGEGGFPGRWDGAPEDPSTTAEGFGEQWSGEADNSAEKAEEFGERWSAGPDDSAERAADFGATWSGDNQEQPKS